MNSARRISHAAIQNMLRDGESLNVWIRGDSMAPMLRDGDRVTAEPVCRPRIGDILLYETAGGLIAHRFIRSHGSILRMRGDASTKLESAPWRQVRGRVAAAERNGRPLALNRVAGLWNNYSFQWKRALAGRMPRLFAGLRGCKRFLFPLAAAFLLLSPMCEALEVKIPYEMVLKHVKRQMFSEGRSYLSGDRTDTCDYAYLENPQMFPQDGRLALQARFNGKTGKEMLGRCVGVGKAFDIVVTGRPVYSAGILRFSDARIQFANSAADAVFGKLLGGFAQDLEEHLTVPLQADIQQLSQTLNRGAAAYRMKIEKFDVTAIDILPDAIHLQIATTVALDEVTK